MFDPYRKWLGIPPEQRPPTHYQLLGIASGENDPEVIEEAALRQTAHIRAYQVGPHSQDCTRILNELAQAKTTLLNPAKRKEYDAQLARKSGAASAVVAHPPAVRAISKAKVPSPPPDEESPRSTTRKVKTRSVVKSGVFLTVPMLLLGAGGVLVVTAAVIVIVVVLFSGQTPRGPAPIPQPVAVAKQKEEVPAKIVPPKIVPKVEPLVKPPVGDPPIGIPPEKNPPEKIPPKNEAPENLELNGADLIQPASPVKLFPAMTLLPDGARLARMTPRGTEIIELDTLKSSTSNLPSGPIIRFSPDGSLCVVSRGAEIIVSTTEAVRKSSFRCRTAFRELAISRDNKFIITGANGELVKGADNKPVLKDNRPQWRDCVVELWDAATGNLLATGEGHQDPVETVGFAEDGTLVSAARDGLRRWDTTGKQIGHFPLDIYHQKITGDGRLCVGMDPRDYHLSGWSISQEKIVHKVKLMRPFNVMCVSHDGRFVLTGLRMQTGKGEFLDETLLWDLPAGVVVRRANVPGMPLALSRDGAVAAFGDFDGRVWRWRIDPNDPANVVNGPPKR